MPVIEIDVNDLEVSVRKLQIESNKIRENLSDLDEPMAKVAILLDRWVQKNFKGEGDKAGGWDKFAKQKYGPNKGERGRWVGKGKDRKFDTSAKLLQDTGRLRASFKPFHSKNNAGIGSKLEYSINHEKGIGVPVRRMLPESDDSALLAKAKRTMELAIMKGVK